MVTIRKKSILGVLLDCGFGGIQSVTSTEVKGDGFRERHV
jgi:hypothetical protein